MIELYQWMRNAEGGQAFGNRQTIEPLTRSLFEQYVVPLIVEQYHDYDVYRQSFRDVSHISLVWRAGETEAVVAAVGSIKQLRPKPSDPRWVILVDSFGSEEAIAHGMTADSDPIPVAIDSTLPPPSLAELIAAAVETGSGDIYYDSSFDSADDSPSSTTIAVQRHRDALAVLSSAGSSLLSAYAPEDAQRMRIIDAARQMFADPFDDDIEILDAAAIFHPEGSDGFWVETRVWVNLSVLEYETSSEDQS